MGQSRTDGQLRSDDAAERAAAGGGGNGRPGARAQFVLGLAWAHFGLGCPTSVSSVGEVDLFKRTVWVALVVQLNA